MQKISNILLPSNYPSEKSMQNCQQTKSNYEPELWEFEYEGYRYLQNISDLELTKRYKDICRNFEVLTTEERQTIPINISQSSWYWYRKEHQTRYEFFLRGKPISPIVKPRIDSNNFFNDSLSYKTLVRYDKLERIKALYDFGRIKINPASRYKEGQEDDPRVDNELEKTKFYMGKHVELETLDGQKIPIIGDMKKILSSSNYYAYCLSYDLDLRMFKEFAYDACLVIKSPDVFIQKLEKAIKRYIPNWYFYYGPISYYDPRHHHEKEYLMPGDCKDFSFAYQKEYRLLWDPLKPTSVDQQILQPIKIEIGSLHDISTIYTYSKK